MPRRRNQSLTINIKGKPGAPKEGQPTVFTDHWEPRGTPRELLEGKARADLEKTSTLRELVDRYGYSFESLAAKTSRELRGLLSLEKEGGEFGTRQG